MANPNAYEYTSFSERFNDSLSTMFAGCKVLLLRPILMLPILISFTTISAIVILTAIALFKIRVALNANLVTPEDVQGKMFVVALIIVFVVIIIQMFSTFLQLEIIQQIETKNRVNLFQAFEEVILKDLLKGIPIVLAWMFINMVTGGNRSSGARFVVRGFRHVAYITIFFICPAIAWEDKDFMAAAKKGIRLAKIHFAEIISCMIQSDFILIVTCLPLIFAVPLFALLSHPSTANTLLPVFVALILMYMVFISCLCFNIEQMFVATYYMWNRKWEKAVIKASVAKEPLPKLYDIPKPSLLDDVPDLL